MQPSAWFITVYGVLSVLGAVSVNEKQYSIFASVSTDFMNRLWVWFPVRKSVYLVEFSWLNLIT